MSDLNKHPDAQRWNRRYTDTDGRSEALWGLQNYHYLLPDSGRALDLACGLGANAMLLAERGLDTHAWDISQVAIDALSRRAEDDGLRIHTEVRDVISQPPESEHYDVIVVGHFLARELAPAIMAALRPEGLLFYQTFNRLAVSDEGPGNPDYRLAENELLHLFAALKLRIFIEEGYCGDIRQGLRNQSLLIAQKPQS